MKRPVVRFLKSGFCARFFLTENKNLHGDRRYRFGQFIHVSASENALETFVQLMTEVMKNIQTDELFVSRMDSLAISLERNIIECNICIDDCTLCVDRQT